MSGFALDTNTLSYYGASAAEFESNFHAAIDDYLAACRELSSAAETRATPRSGA